MKREIKMDFYQLQERKKKKVEAWASAVWQWQLFHFQKNEYEAPDIKPNGDHYLLLTEAVCQQPHKCGIKNKNVILKFAEDFIWFVCLRVYHMMPVTQGEIKLLCFDGF